MGSILQILIEVSLKTVLHEIRTGNLQPSPYPCYLVEPSDGSWWVTTMQVGGHVHSPVVFPTNLKQLNSMVTKPKTKNQNQKPKTKSKKIKNTNTHTCLFTHTYLVVFV